jgi:hypothetical protein
MSTSNELPPTTRKTPLPYVTISAATIGLLIPLVAIALLFYASPSAETEATLSGKQKLRELQATEERQLTTYDWIEKPGADKPGIVRIPVSRAKELFLKESAAQSQQEKKP